MPNRDCEQHPLVQRLPPAYAATAEDRAIPPGTAVHLVAVDPATHFDFRYQSREGVARVIRLKVASLTANSAEPHQIEQFHASVHPEGKPTICTFFTLPESIAMSARAIVLIEGGISGDRIICRSLGSVAGLKVTVRIIRNGEDILREEIQDTNEHKFQIR